MNASIASSTAATSRVASRSSSSPRKRIGSGTYTLDELPDNHTRVTFENAWQQPLVRDRVAAPLVRAILRRGNQRAMERLAEQLALHEAAVAL